MFDMTVPLIHLRHMAMYTVGHKTRQFTFVYIFANY